MDRVKNEKVHKSTGVERSESTEMVWVHGENG